MPPPPPVAVLIEDQPELGRVIREVLGEEGFEVVQVPDATAAFGAIEERDVALLVSDLPSRGREHGDPLARIAAAFPELPLIIIRDPRVEDVPFFGPWRQEGVRRMLRRPFRIDDLAAAAREIRGEVARR